MWSNAYFFKRFFKLFYKYFQKYYRPGPEEPVLVLPAPQGALRLRLLSGQLFKGIVTRETLNT